MAITVTFDPPLPSDDPATFNTKAFTLLGDLNDWSTEANSLASTVNSNASSASSSASTATTKAGEAATSASDAAASAAEITDNLTFDADGNVGVGATPLSYVRFQITGTPASSATTQYGFYSDRAAPAAATSGFSHYAAIVTTDTTAFTITSYQCYLASVGTYGSTTITNLSGFRAGATFTAGTNNYGFYSAIPAASGRWGFYAAGTAANGFSGDVNIFGAGVMGYTTGSGGTVTQVTSRTTGVTLNKTNGAITLVSAAGSASWQSFTVTNSLVTATSVVVLSQKSGTDKYMMHVTNVAAGSFQITFATTGGTTTEQPVINFAVFSGATA